MCRDSSGHVSRGFRRNHQPDSLSASRAARPPQFLSVRDIIPPRTSCNLLAAAIRPYSQQNYDANLAWAGLYLIAHRSPFHESPTPLTEKEDLAGPRFVLWHALPGADVPIITEPLLFANSGFLGIYKVACAVSWSYTRMLQRIGRRGHLHPQLKTY